MRRGFIVALAAVGLVGCMKLDGLFFEADKATSIEKDYHGLPLTIASNPPEWMARIEVEREIYIATPSGRRLTEAEREDAKAYFHGAFIPAPSDCPADTCPLVGQGVTFLYQHGNSGHLWRYWYRAVALWSLGANVFVYTYRGYGLSSGEANRKNVLTDATAAMTYVRSRDDVNLDRIIAYGYSMGGIPTSYLVGRSDHAGQFLGAVLESALDSPDATLDLSTGAEFPRGFFMDDTLFDGPVFLKHADELPILHIHGGADERVVPDQAEQYYQVLKSWDAYTHYLGKETKPHEDWVKTAGHRNVPIEAFKAEHHIADYDDHKDNPSHCCIHPAEYTEPAHAAFLDTIGRTTGDEMRASAEAYHNLVSDWVLSVLE